MRALERMLQQKERHLEGQQAKLAAWAAELQRREAALAWQQAQMLDRGSEAPGAAPAASPGSSLGPPLEPIPSTSPVLPAGHAGTPPSARPATPSSVSPLYAARAGLGVQQTEQQQTASPAAVNGGGSGSPGALPDSPAVPGEWTEEFEPGVLLSFAAEGGAKKLRRIRFSRSLFSADSAKQVGGNGATARLVRVAMLEADRCCGAQQASQKACDVDLPSLYERPPLTGSHPADLCSGTRQTSTGWRRPPARPMRAPPLP